MCHPKRSKPKGGPLDEKKFSDFNQNRLKRSEISLLIPKTYISIGVDAKLIN